MLFSTLSYTLTSSSHASSPAGLARSRWYTTKSLCSIKASPATDHARDDDDDDDITDHVMLSKERRASHLCLGLCKAGGWTSATRSMCSATKGSKDSCLDLGAPSQGRSQASQCWLWLQRVAQALKPAPPALPWATLGLRAAAHSLPSCLNCCYWEGPWPATWKPWPACPAALRGRVWHMAASASLAGMRYFLVSKETLTSTHLFNSFFGRGLARMTGLQFPSDTQPSMYS